MHLTSLKKTLAALLLRAAQSLSPPPVILPGAAGIPVDPAERARLYERIAFTAIAWMGHVTDAKQRAAAAGVLKRTYPGIWEQVDTAHKCAMAFHPQLQDLLRAEAAAAETSAREEGTA